MRSIIFSLFLSTLIWAQAPAPVPTTQSTGGVVTGTVKIGTRLVRGVSVAIQRDMTTQAQLALQRNGAPPPPAAPMLRAISDERGQFVFSGVPAGDYRVSPIPEVYVLADSSLAATGVPVKLSEGQSTAQVELALARGGVITGRVTDPEGRPVIAERVNISRSDPAGPLRGNGGGNRSGAETDDRGIYRVYGLTEGRYVLSAGSENAYFGPVRRVQYARTWYPNVQEEAQAAIVEISPGKVAENIDIKLGEPIKTYAVEGRAIDASTGKPVPGVSISAVRARNPRGGPGFGSMGNSALSDAQGVFRITGLPTGSYTATTDSVTGAQRSLTTEYYSEPAGFQISEGDASGLEVRLHLGVAITGIVRIEGLADGPAITAALAGTIVTAVVRGEQSSPQGGGEQGLPPSGRFGNSEISPDGSFRIGGLVPGRITLSLNTMRGPSTRLGIVRLERSGSAIGNEFHAASGEQILNLVLIAREANASIRGKVVITGGTGGAAQVVRVTARPLDAAGQTQSDTVDQNGAFEIQGLMPGSYEITARAMIRQQGGPQQGGPQQGRPGGPGGGRPSTGGRPPQMRIPEVKQMVSVTGGNVATITLTLDVSQQ